MFFFASSCAATAVQSTRANAATSNIAATTILGAAIAAKSTVAAIPSLKSTLPANTQASVQRKRNLDSGGVRRMRAMAWVKKKCLPVPRIRGFPRTEPPLSILWPGRLMFRECQDMAGRDRNLGGGGGFEYLILLRLARGSGDENIRARRDENLHRSEDIRPQQPSSRMKHGRLLPTLALRQVSARM